MGNILYNFIEGYKAEGKSTYDIWKAAGNEGGAAEFLEFLRNGVDGINIAKIETATSQDGLNNIVTITMSNGEKHEFTVKNGEKGDKGGVFDKLSELTNDAGFITNTEVVNAVSAHNTASDTHTDIRDLILGLTTRLNTLVDSDDTTLDQMSEIIAYIKSNKSLIESITTSKVSVSDIVDNLTTNESAKVLSAAQGVSIKSLLDALQTEMSTVKKSVSDGKTSVANAITAQGLTTATDAEFATMATNIGTVATNKYNAGVSDTKVGNVDATDVLTGKTFTNASGVGITGTMRNNGAVSQSLNCGESYTILAGYHNGSGIITANSLVSQTDATATADKIIEGETAWVNGVKITGTAKEAPPNGKVWTQSNITSGSIAQVQYANGIWVAGSSYSKKGLYYSIDGINWTQSNVINGRFYTICNANGIWVAGGDSLSIYYSTDGKTWYESDSGICACYDIYTNDTIWVASCTNRVLYSMDGKTWTTTNKNFTFYKSRYANGVWVSSTSYGNYYSTDGIDWLECNNSFNTISRYIYYANGIWLDGTQTGDAGIIYSTDGINWVQSNITSGNCNCIYYANGLYVIGMGSSGLYYSEDGINWVQSNITTYQFSFIYNANGLWVACSSHRYSIFYSQDGKIWTMEETLHKAFGPICNANGIWVAGSDNSEGFFYSKSS